MRRVRPHVGHSALWRQRARRERPTFRSGWQVTLCLNWYGLAIVREAWRGGGLVVRGLLLPHEVMSLQRSAWQLATGNDGLRVTWTGLLAEVEVWRAPGRWPGNAALGEEVPRGVGAGGSGMVSGARWASGSVAWSWRRCGGDWAGSRTGWPRADRRRGVRQAPAQVRAGRAAGGGPRVPPPSCRGP